MVSQNITMPRKKKPVISTEKYRKPARMVRVRQRLAKQGDVLAEKLDKDLTEIVNDALREYLQRAGVWPPDAEPE